MITAEEDHRRILYFQREMEGKIEDIHSKTKRLRAGLRALMSIEAKKEFDSIPMLVIRDKDHNETHFVYRLTYLGKDNKNLHIAMVLSLKGADAPINIFELNKSEPRKLIDMITHSMLIFYDYETVEPTTVYLRDYRSSIQRDKALLFYSPINLPPEAKSIEVNWRNEASLYDIHENLFLSLINPENKIEAVSTDIVTDNAFLVQLDYSYSQA